MATMKQITLTSLHKNTHHEDALMRRARQAGIADKKVTLPDGSVISYGEGPGNGPALLLIHGQTVAWQDYAAVLPQLSRRFHVFAVDCYGHGQSSHHAELYSCETNGKALTWFMSNVIKGGCFVSGHSSGGILAAWLAAHTPGQVRGAVLEDPPLFRVTPEEVQAGKGAFAWYDTYRTTHEFVNQREETDYTLYYLQHGYLPSLFGGLQPRIVRSARKYREKNPGKPVRISWAPHSWLRFLRYLDHYDPAFGQAFYDGSWMKGVDQEGMLRAIRCPVIYLKASTRYGKDDVLYAATTDGDAERVQALIPGCERINIESGHDIHADHPEEFVSACEKLLKEL